MYHLANTAVLHYHPCCILTADRDLFSALAPEISVGSTARDRRGRVHSARNMFRRVGASNIDIFRGQGGSVRCFSSVISKHQGVRAARPLIGHYTPRWPLGAKKQLPKELVPVPRTVPSDKLRYQFRTTFNHGSAILYPHLKFHPADFKVGLVVKLEDCGFMTDLEKEVFIEMVGPRYNTGKKEVRLTSDRFSNRIENKKYLGNLLEKLIAESKRLAASPDSA